MTDHLKLTIADLESKLSEQVAQVVKTKNIINQLSAYAGLEPPYPDAETSAATIGEHPRQQLSVQFESDAFFTKPLATSVKMVLDARKDQGLGPAETDEIYAALKAGGYNFEQKDEENAKRGLAVSVSKNTAVFVRLPNGKVGLTSWYGGRPAKRARNSSAAHAEEPSSDGSSPNETPAEEDASD